jgi:hypothetical protein
MIEFALGGLTMKRSARDILFGYKDEIIHMLKVKDPATGGDPSLNSWIIAGDPNMTQPDAALFP